MNIKSTIIDKNTNIDLEFMQKQINLLNVLSSSFTLKKRTKLCPHNFFSTNEIKISEKIKEIPYWVDNFDIVEGWDLIQIAKIEEKSVEKVDYQDAVREKKYILLQYLDKKEKSFPDFLFSFSSPVSFLFHVLNTYSTLLEYLQHLNQHGICFFDLSTEHVFFQKNNRPLLCHFQNSLIKERLKETYISSILTKVQDYTCKPLEVHVLFYLIENSEETLSYSYMEMIVDIFIETKPFFSFFSQEYKENYKKEAILFLKPLINQPKSVIIHKMLSYVDTWDNYSLSVIFLHVIGHVSQSFDLKEDFMKHFLQLLSKNTNPNPLKRERLEESIYNWNKLFSVFTDWRFIKEIPLQKMKTLHKML